MRKREEKKDIYRRIYLVNNCEPLDHVDLCWGDHPNPRPSDAPLSETGQQQTGDVVRFFQMMPAEVRARIAQVFVAPLRRCLQTAVPLAKSLAGQGVQVAIEYGLRPFFPASKLRTHQEHVQGFPELRVRAGAYDEALKSAQTEEEEEAELAQSASVAAAAALATKAAAATERRGRPRTSTLTAAGGGGGVERKQDERREEEDEEEDTEESLDAMRERARQRLARDHTGWASSSSSSGGVGDDDDGGESSPALLNTRYESHTLERKASLDPSYRKFSERAVDVFGHALWQSKSADIVIVADDSVIDCLLQALCPIASAGVSSAPFYGNVSTLVTLREKSDLSARLAAQGKRQTMQAYAAQHPRAGSRPGTGRQSSAAAARAAPQSSSSVYKSPADSSSPPPSPPAFILGRKKEEKLQQSAPPPVVDAQAAVTARAEAQVKAAAAAAAAAAGVVTRQSAGSSLPQLARIVLSDLVFFEDPDCVNGAARYKRAHLRQKRTLCGLGMCQCQPQCRTYEGTLLAKLGLDMLPVELQIELNSAQGADGLADGLVSAQQVERLLTMGPGSSTAREQAEPCAPLSLDEEEEEEEEQDDELDDRETLRSMHKRHKTLLSI